MVDDHPVVREGLRRIVEEGGPAAVTGEAASREDALAALGSSRWDLVILDISLEGQSGLELLKEVHRLYPATPVLMLSMHAEEQYALRAFRAGAAGYVTKQNPRDTLRAAMAKVLGGGRYVSPALAERLVADLERPPALHRALSDREHEVLRLLASGRAVIEIAELLGISDKTVSTYRTRILEKLGIRTNAEIIRYALEHRLID